MKELAIINDGNEIRYIDPSELKPSTLQDWISAGYGYDDIGVNPIGEYGDQKFIADWIDGEKEWDEIAEETIDDYYCVRYHDGNNWQIDIIPTENVSFEECEIEDLEDPNPAYYFRYRINVKNGSSVICTKSNMSGLISPYYYEDQEEAERMEIAELEREI